MPDVRFISKDGHSVDGAIVRKLFFECAIRAGLISDHASAIWRDAVQGDSYSRQLIKRLCDIKIVDADNRFGFLK